MKKKLAVIGASFGQKSLYLKAKEMGIETHCFAQDKDALCKEYADFFYPISIFEKEQILDVCKEIQIDGITSTGSDICVPTVWFVAEKMGLIGNKYEDSLISINKFYQRQAFVKKGVNSPLFTLAGEKMNLDGFTYPLIVKPTDRGSSMGVMKVEKEEDLKNAIEQAKKISYSNQAIVEEFVTGSEATADVITWKGKHYIITIGDTETLGGPYYTKIGYHQPSGLGRDIWDKITIEAEKALTALNINYGASDVEVMVTAEGEVKIIEVNPRLGGDTADELLILSRGYDIVKTVINIALNQFEEPVFPVNKYSGVYFLSKETNYLRSIIENKENYPEIVKADIYENELQYLQEILGRNGHLIYQSDQKRSWRKKNFPE